MPLHIVLSVFSYENIIRMLSQHVNLFSVSLSTKDISQNDTKSSFEILMGHGKPFYSCYSNDSKHTLGTLSTPSDLNYLFPIFK